MTHNRRTGRRESTESVSLQVGGRVDVTVVEQHGIVEMATGAQVTAKGLLTDSVWDRG